MKSLLLNELGYRRRLQCHGRDTVAAAAIHSFG